MSNIQTTKTAIFTYASSHGQVACYSGAVKAVASRKNKRELTKLISQLQAILAAQPNIKGAARALRACIRLQDNGWNAPTGRGGYVAEAIRAKKAGKPVSKPRRRAAKTAAASDELEALRAEMAQMRAKLAQYEPAEEPAELPVWPNSFAEVCSASVKTLRTMAGAAQLDQSGSKAKLMARLIEGMNAQ